MHFKATHVNDNKKYEFTLNFFNKINPDKVSNKNTGRSVEFIIYKVMCNTF